MRPVPDELLLNLAAIAATLLGLLVVGVFFYVETGLRRLEQAQEPFGAFIRAASRLTMSLYGLTFSVSIALVALKPAWARATFALAAAGVLLATLDWTIRSRAMGAIMGSAVWSPLVAVVAWIWVAAMLAIPWVMGGLHPSREHLTWAVLLTMLTALVSTLEMLLSVFDISAFEQASRLSGNREEPE